MSDLLRPEDTVFTHLVVMMREARQGIRSAISSMKRRPDVIIADMLSTKSLPIAGEFGMQKYVFTPILARTVGLVTYLPTLDKEVSGQYVDRTNPLNIRGCVPIQCENVPHPMLDRNNREYDEYVRMGNDFATLPDGILINTWRGMEPRFFDALKYNETFRLLLKIPIYDIGPLTRDVNPVVSKGSKVVKWLDMQPIESVLFVSFGSGGTLSLEQITELAWGMELSQQKFVWVVRPPPTSSTAEGAYFVAGGGPDHESGPSCFLPKGYLARNEKLGLVVLLWAPQVEILNHVSIRGFLSHYGVSSVCESIAAGVPMIAWPLHAEKRLNASTLVEEVKVAMRPTKKVVGRVEIEKMVRSLMKGE
ncbi:anthocyanidin 3-O-glucosyltransferase 5-like protein [Tanacetum coccineum]